MLNSRTMLSFFLLGALSLFARQNKDSLDKRLSDLEHQMSEIAKKNANGTLGAHFASFKPTENNWSGNLEILAWKAQVGGLDWVIIFNQASYPLSGQMKSLNFKWNWGARVGLTRYFGNDDWDLSVYYTNFTASHGAKVLSNFNSLDNLTGSVATGSTTGNFKGKINLNQIDLTLGKKYFISSKFSYHPAASLTALFLKQRYDLITSNTINALSTSIPIAGSLNTDLIDECKTFVIGPKIGLDIFYYLCRGFTLNAGISGALLEGYFKVYHNEKLNSAPTNDTPLVVSENINAPLHRFSPYARLFIGLGYHKEFMEGKRTLDLALKWEMNEYFRMNQTLQTISSFPSAPSFAPGDQVRTSYSRYSEDLGFNGVTIEVKIGF